MNNFIPPATTSRSPPAPKRGFPASSLSLISKGLSEMRNSADAELQLLLRDSANSFKNLDLGYVKQQLSEFRWTPPRPRIVIDLSAIRNAIVEEVGEGGERRVRVLNVKGTRVRFKEFKEGGGDHQGLVKDWEPIRASKMKELEVKKNGDLAEKLQSSLKAFRLEFHDSKEVPLLDLQELLAYFVRQSGPFLDQLGVRREICDKIVQSLCSKHKNQLPQQFAPGGELSPIDCDNVNDELDLRIANVLQSTSHYEGGFWSDIEKHRPRAKARHVAIITTASLPWLTGTAVNPLFRAAYLAKYSKQKVTLLVPWLCKSDQELVYPNSITFHSPEEQQAYIRNWVEDRVGFKADFKISFYPGKFSKERRSIIPLGDTSQFIPSKEADIAILEEPEHLNWYHHGRRWTDKFNYVVGVVHTNYLEYIKREKNGAVQAFFVKHINTIVTRAYCHKVLRLSAATQDLPKSVVCNVHGVNPKFLEIGEKLASERASCHQPFSKGAYFLGKMVWAKGYRELINLWSKNYNELNGLELDVFGSGEDAQEVESAAKELKLHFNFQKGRDHADASLHGYKVFINPSISDVLCTATAEALAMGKFVVCADHPSNEFFKSFPNCLTYKTSEEFVAKVKEALGNEPESLTQEQRYILSWEAATERFMEHSDLEKLLKLDQGGPRSERNGVVVSVLKPKLSEIVDGGLAFVHYCFTGSEILRLATGAIPGSQYYDKQHCQDLHLLPPHVVNHLYGW